MAVFILAPDPDGNCCECSQRANPCDSCGGGGANCKFTLPFTEGVAPGDVFADYAEANDNLIVASCIGYFYDVVNFPVFPVTLGSASSTPPDTVNLSLNTRVELAAGRHKMCAYLTTDGSDLNVSYTVTTIGTSPVAYVTILDATNRQVVYDETLVGSVGSKDYALSAGSYIFMGGGGADAGTFTTVNTSFVLTSTVLIATPVVALYDDAGTTRELEDCPKMLLPALTESTENWYSSESDAQAVLDDPLQVSNCKGFSEGGPGLTAFTATDGGTSLTLATQDVAGVFTWASINLQDGATLTATGSVSAGTASMSVWIYDYAGTLVEHSGISIPSPWTSAALPYTGRYIIKVVTESTVGTANASSVLTSSGTMSVNQIQALYDVGVDCPARLNC